MVTAAERMARFKKNSTIDDSAILNESEIFNNRDVLKTSVPAMNVALAGDLDAGLISGLTLLCGNSKMFKSGYGMLLMAEYLRKHPDAVALFYDSEFGSPDAYFNAYGIDKSRVFHTPITDLEKLRFDLAQQLEDIKRGDKVFIFIDSIGNLASKKEVEDALAGKGAADMTRAKYIKGIFRMITPHLSLKDIPMVAVNHIYMEQGMFPKAIVSGGTGIYLSADTIFIIGRQTDKNGTEIQGYNFVITVEKSRHVKEKSKIPISISYKSGIDKYSGMLAWALEAGFIVQSGAWYQTVDLESGEINPKKIRASSLDSSVWEPIIANQKFKEFIKDKYQVSTGNLLEEDTPFVADDIDEDEVD